MKTIKLALIGYGNVGKAFAKMLRQRTDYICDHFNTEAVITAICTRSKGALIDGSGIDTENLDNQAFEWRCSPITYHYG